MSELRAMTQAEYTAFLEHIIPDYAADNVRAGYWSESESLEKSQQQISGLLPQGVETQDHYLYTLYDNDQAVGVIWLKTDLTRPIKSGFIYDVEVWKQFRGKGYGKQLMVLIEDKARELGVQRMGLHVFGYNKVARNLYEGLGYEVTSLNMLKDL